MPIETITKEQSDRNIDRFFRVHGIDGLLDMLTAAGYTVYTGEQYPLDDFYTVDSPRYDRVLHKVTADELIEWVKGVARVDLEKQPELPFHNAN